MKKSSIQSGHLYQIYDSSIVEVIGPAQSEQFVTVREINSGRELPIHPRRIVRELSEREAEAYRPKR